MLKQGPPAAPANRSPQQPEQQLQQPEPDTSNPFFSPQAAASPAAAAAAGAPDAGLPCCCAMQVHGLPCS